MRRPTFSQRPWQNVDRNALHCGHCSGRRALRVLGPSAIADAAIQPTFPESSGFVRPFFPSAPSHKPRLRADRKGGGIRFDLSSGVLENQFRDSLNDPGSTDRVFLPSRSFSGVKRPSGSNDRQECTFPGGKCGRALSLNLRASGTLRRDSPFFNPPITNQNKAYATQSKTWNRPH